MMSATRTPGAFEISMSLFNLRKWPVPAAALAAALSLCAAQTPQPPRPNILLLTIDTLRADRLATYGYERTTSPTLDALISRGVVFESARTVEPLTAPALCAMITSRFPHETGSTRNGLRMRPGLASLPKLLQDEGYLTGGIVANWTLRDKISGIGEHFDDYLEIIKHKRWFGLVSGEAHADQVTDVAIDWLERHDESEGDRPFMLWVHYVDPHAPYKRHKSFLDALGIEKRRNVSASDRYDTEIAYTDQQIARLLDRLQSLGMAENLLIAFTSDHGESLGEHDYWGHGRNLYEPTLRVPMAIVWPGKLEARRIVAPALNIDLAPTVARLLGLETPGDFRGFDWTGVFGGAAEPFDRATQHQAHRGAVLTGHDSDSKRLSGLLEVGVVMAGQKEIVRVKNDNRWRFDLRADPRELVNLAEPGSDLTGDLRSWLEFVDFGLRQSDQLPPEPLDEETVEQLRSLGYAD